MSVNRKIEISNLFLKVTLDWKPLIFSSVTIYLDWVFIQARTSMGNSLGVLIPP